MTAESGDTLADIETQRSLGRISPDEIRDRLAVAMDTLNGAIAKWESGEWDSSGVKDDDWVTYIAGEPVAYARSCAPAYELKD